MYETICVSKNAIEQFSKLVQKLYVVLERCDVIAICLN